MCSGKEDPDAAATPAVKLLQFFTDAAERGRIFAA
jgi:hypothetical protein